MTPGRPARFETTLHVQGRELLARFDGSTWELSTLGSKTRTSRSLLALLHEACGDDAEGLRAAIDAILAAMDSDLPSMRDSSWSAARLGHAGGDSPDQREGPAPGRSSSGR